MVRSFVNQQNSRSASVLGRPNRTSSTRNTSRLLSERLCPRAPRQTEPTRQEIHNLFCRSSVASNRRGFVGCGIELLFKRKRRKVANKTRSYWFVTQI